MAEKKNQDELTEMPHAVNEIKRVSSDTYFKYVFDDIVFVQRFIKWVFRNKEELGIDLTGLEPVKTDFIDEDLKASFLDALFRVPFNNGDEKSPGYLFFLFEHKSVNDWKVPLQVLRYMAQVWGRIEKQMEK